MNNGKTKIVIISSLAVGILLISIIVAVFLFSPNGIVSNMTLEGTYIHEAEVETFDVALFTLKTTATFKNNSIEMAVYDPLLGEATLSRTGTYKLDGSDIIVTWKDTPEVGDLSFSFSWFIGDEWQVPFQRGKETVLLDGEEYLRD